ncbi:glycosyltransferase family 2 protein [Lacrimispora sp. AGF001]|uniref:glycosyltransferase family 2 protein n=1 Tax=Lacrimispora sp. AGF001 TaxID=3401631 RepID=UPI003B42CD6D
MEDSLYVVMPAYNEEANIEAAVKDWYKILEGKSKSSRIVIADNGSTDKTHLILESMKHDFPQLEIVSNTEKQHGPKLIALYKKAIADKVDYVFQTDSDGQTNPNEFDEFWHLRDKYDCIIGHRSVRGDGKSRAFVEHVVCLLLRIYFGIKVPDANAPFRLMKVKVVEKYINKLPYDYNIPNIMMTTYFAHYNEKMVFKEISFKPRQGGVNSVNIPRIIKIGWNALKGFRKFKKEL